MRTNNIKVTLSYKIPYDVPDLNGNIYAKEAIEKAIIKCKESLQNGGKLPLIYNNNSTVAKEEVIGVIEHLWDVQYNEIEKYIQVDAMGMLWYGGTCENIEVMEDDEAICKGNSEQPTIKLIKGFEIASFGISNFQ